VAGADEVAEQVRGHQREQRSNCHPRRKISDTFT